VCGYKSKSLHECAEHLSGHRAPGLVLEYLSDLKGFGVQV